MYEYRPEEEMTELTKNKKNDEDKKNDWNISTYKDNVTEIRILQNTLITRR